MPRASWTGFLRLSLVSAPVYLSPATSEAKRIRLNQLNAETGNRLKQQLVDSETGEIVERDQIAKGYEYDRGRYVTISDEELKELQIESSKIIDLDQFVDRDDVDPVYLDAPYYVYPDGELADEAFRVIGEAMAQKGKVGLGKVVLSSRGRLVLVEPRDGGLLMSTLHSADEVRPAEFSSKHKGTIDAERSSRAGQEVLDLVENLGKPVVAAINGFALGGGCETAMACTIRIAVEHAKFGQPEVKLGLLPGGGGTQRLPRLVGKGRALQLILSGGMISAAEAFRIGLVDEVVPAEDLIPRAEAILKVIAANAPVAVRYSLEAVNKGMETSQSEGFDLEASYFGLCAGTEDKKEGTSAFLEKRAPQFRGR
jgi:Ku protein